ncbi:MAG TPA: S41 family peptidase [Bdellovibrionota bacterium]|jgi:carboxyl-terminal processing protease|nr:S41 family peptidase [Bdellovibrionota bacterium]
MASILALLLATLMPLQAWADPAPAKGARKEQDKRYANVEMFEKVLRFVEDNYVDEVKHEDLIYGAIKGMMETLDPHSAFLAPDLYRDMKVDTSGKFGGLGIEIGMKDNVLTIIAPIEETPAWYAGIRPGDRIVKIDGKSTKGLSLYEAVANMRGADGSKVTLTIYRKGFDHVRDVVLKRKTIKMSAVKFEELEPGYGYIRLRNFNEDASKDMKAAIEKMDHKNKLKGLVFDMRNTPGGLLDQAVEVSSLFMDKGVVVSTIGRDRDRKEVKHARPNWTVAKDLPLAVLVNGSTASAAEIVAGALQDHKRAVIVGQTTFGKGSVQQVMDLGSNAGMKITIARYYTPSGRSIQEKGVAPDLYLDEYDNDLLAKARVARATLRERDLEGHIRNDGDEDGSNAGEYTPEELQQIESGKAAASPKGEDAAMTPAVVDPKTDFQVQETLNYLKSYDIFKRLAKHDDSP